MPKEYFGHPCRFPKNADGPFYTTGHVSRTFDNPETPPEMRGNCLWCGAPEAEAPELFAPFDDTYEDTYFIRQPVTAEETARAIRAVQVCCIRAVRYGGKDREIIARLGNDPAVCDFVVNDSGDLIGTVDTEGGLLPFAQMIAERISADLQHEWKKRNKKWWQFWL